MWQADEACIARLFHKLYTDLIANTDIHTQSAKSHDAVSRINNGMKVTLLQHTLHDT